jgi:hypothetical protein
LGPDNSLGISARTAENLHLELEGVPPVPHPHQTFNFTVHHYHFKVESIAFPAEELDTLTGSELQQLLSSIQPEGTSETSTENHEPEDEIFAILPNIELRLRFDNTGTTTRHPFCGELDSSSRNCFFGQVGGGEFCLEDRDGDLRVYFRRPMALNANGGLSAGQIFDGILTVVGYIHGAHPWPYYRQHRADHRIIERRMRAPQNCQRAGLPPMTESRMMLGEDGRNLFLRAVEFFAAGTETAQYYSRILWLMREANYEGMAYELRLLALCSILEGVAKRQSPGGRLGTPIESWQATIENAGLAWDSWFIHVYESWLAYRNPSAHGFDPPGAQGQPSGDLLNAYSRITAAIYILMAKQMGFSGTMEASLLENLRTVSVPE